MGITLQDYTHLCSELVTISTGESSDRLQTVIGNLEEIGEWKARLLVDRPMTTGTGVVVNAGGNSLKGSVRSWTYEPDLGYFVDVQLNRESRWSPKSFRPQHLLRIQDLTEEPGIVAA
jgi:hypothetical protein